MSPGLLAAITVVKTLDAALAERREKFDAAMAIVDELGAQYHADERALLEARRAYLRKFAEEELPIPPPEPQARFR